MAPMTCGSARLYHCARCHRQVILGRGCDRGNVYCFEGCAGEARCETLRLASRRYRCTRQGRQCNADRQRRHRERHRRALAGDIVREAGAEEVTHQGSVSAVAAALLASPSIAMARWISPRIDARVHCQRCRRECLPFLRRGFLRPPERGRRGVRAERLLHEGHR